MVVDADFAYHLPVALCDAEVTPLLCGGVIGYRALKLSEVKPGETLGLYGFGNSAHITIQVARHFGAARSMCLRAVPGIRSTRGH